MSVRSSSHHAVRLVFSLLALLHVKKALAPDCSKDIAGNKKKSVFKQLFANRDSVTWKILVHQSAFFIATSRVCMTVRYPHTFYEYLSQCMQQSRSFVFYMNLSFAKHDHQRWMVNPSLCGYQEASEIPSNFQ